MGKDKAGGAGGGGSAWGREGQLWAGRAKLQPEEGQGQQGDVLG